MADEKSTDEGVTMSQPPKADAANQDVSEYLKARASSISKEVLRVLGVNNNSEHWMFLELMFRTEYWQSRNSALEGSLLKFVRHYLAARKVLEKTGMSKEDVKKAIDEELVNIPEDLDKTPEV